MEVGAMIVSIHMLVCSVLVYRRGYRPALYFLFGWITFLLGIIIFVLKDFDVLPYNNLTRYMMQTGSALETILLSFALAARINIYKREKEESQIKNLELHKENEKIITEQNIMLEERVKVRTEQLEATNKSLKEAEANLVNAEKMSSLGLLTAGISHEINNPINFVVSNVKPLKRDVEDVLSILKEYNNISENENLKVTLERIEKMKSEVDLDYVIQEINLLLKGIEEGAVRTSEIVKGLKSFARSDEADVKSCNIHEGIESTLTLLNHNLSEENIRVIKNYGNVSVIDCFPGKLNQVFMNLLGNAIHAVSARKDKTSRIIEITTNHAGENVEIKVKDNGIGIPEENLNKIFEPFFTTKEVGKGTGLGLSIVYGIITSHNGKISVSSVENTGTEFVISLPLHFSKVGN